MIVVGVIIGVLNTDYGRIESESYLLYLIEFQAVKHGLR